MMDGRELGRDIAEEDEVRTLLSTNDPLPPLRGYSSALRRTQQGRLLPGMAIAAVTAMLAVVVISGVLLGTRDREPVAATASPVSTSEPSPHDAAAAVSATITTGGYRIEVAGLNDPGFGPEAGVAWMQSSIVGVGLRCTWIRVGPEQAAASTLWGTPQSVVTTGAGYAPVPSGTRAVRESGLPSGAQRNGANSAGVVCGVRDAAGDHAALVRIELERRGTVYIATVVTASDWVLR